MEIKEIERAAKRLKSVVHSIPLHSSQTFSQMSAAELYLKCENQQKTGSFKVRGAYNKIAAMAETEDKPDAVVASSAGNHAQGVAYAASTLSISATIVMPKSAPIAKIAATEGYGANVILHGETYDDAYNKALEIQKETGAVFVHAFDDPLIIAGQGTIALEILQNLPTVDTVLVPAGGGGLIAGMASCIKQINPRIRVIGVQAQGADSIVRSFEAGHRINAESVKTIADGIAVKIPGKLTLDMIYRYVDEMITVTDDEIASAIVLLLERTKQVVEPSGAASVAAAIQHKTDLSGQKVVCVLSGGNIDVSFMNRIVERGLVQRGRQMQFRTIMNDTPGNLEKVTRVISRCGANIIMVQHDRLRADLRLNETALNVACEVGGPQHGKELVAALESEGYQVILDY